MLERNCRRVWHEDQHKEDQSYENQQLKSLKRPGVVFVVLLDGKQLSQVTHFNFLENLHPRKPRGGPSGGRKFRADTKVKRGLAFGLTALGFASLGI